MRGFRVGLAVVCFALPASAEGYSSDNGQPFPTQVGGWRFGLTKQQAADICAKSGGAIAEAARTSLDGAFFCTPVPDPPAVTAVPGSLRADLCGQTICQLEMFWNHISKDSALEIDRALETKYGAETPAPNSVSIAQLEALCRQDPTSGKTFGISWLFGGVPRKDGVRDIAGFVGLTVACEGDGRGLSVMASYANQQAALRSIKRNTANY